MAEIKYHGSKGVAKKELFLGDLPETSGGIVSTDFTPIQPQSGWKETDFNLITFEIPALPSTYTDLSKSFLYLRLKIVKQDGTALIDEDIVGPSCNFFGSLIENVQVLFNDTLVNKTQGGLYPYRHFLNNLLFTPKSIHDSTLTSELFFDDDAGTFTSSDSQFVKRKGFTDSSNYVELLGKIHEGILDSRPIPDNVNIQINIRRTSPNFSLVGSGTKTTTTIPPAFKIVYDQVVFYAKRLIVNQEVVKKNEAWLKSGKKLYFPTRNLDIKSFQIPVGSLSVTSNVLWAGTIPRFVLIGLVDAKCTKGDMTKSPYEFKQHNIQQIIVDINGALSTVCRQVSFEESMYLLGYNSLASICKDGHTFDRSTYSKKNRFFVAVEIQPEAGNKFSIQSNQQVKIEIRFSTATTESLDALIFGEFDNLVSVDKDRKIYSDALVV